MEFIEFILGDIWHFIGFVIILIVLFVETCCIIDHFKY